MQAGNGFVAARGGLRAGTRKLLVVLSVAACIVVIADSLSACQHFQHLDHDQSCSDLFRVRSAIFALRGGSDMKEPEFNGEGWENPGNTELPIPPDTPDIHVAEDASTRRRRSKRRGEALGQYNELREQEQQDRFVAAIDLNPSSGELICSFAEWLRERGKTQRATEEYEKAVALSPDHPLILNNFASFIQHSHADYPRAQSLYEKALAAASEDGDRKGIMLNVAQAMVLQRHDPEQVDDMFLSAWKLDPTDPDVLVNYAMFRQTVSDYVGAERLLRQAVAIDQGHLQGLNGLAILLETIKAQPLDAEECYRRAYETDSSDVATLANLAHNLHAFKRDFDAAESLYKRVLSLHPAHPSALCNYGHLLQNERGNIAAAESLYKQAIALDPEHQPSLLNYAGLVAKWGQEYHLALALYQQALRVSPTQLIALTNYASMLHHGMQRLDEAEKVYKQTLALQPAYIPALVNYGLLLEQQKLNEEAAALYQQALDVDPTASIPASAQSISCLHLRATKPNSG
mmetsp:Transcript_24520/g.58379  ORF Transcript_24520/g.58379 Transcript_24520/m.58379 type:complete len:517 (+) Transcript_24520:176-1726(+)